VLRARLVRYGASWTLDVPAGVDVELWIRRIDITGLDDDRRQAVITEAAEAARDRPDPEAGVMVAVVWFDPGSEPGRLLMIVRHLVVDEVSCGC
jgi:hypothetical protein